MNTSLTRIKAQAVTPLFERQSPASSPHRQLQWSYQFQDGSLLKGILEGNFEATQPDWLRIERIEADYISNDGKTRLLHWEGQDFACFDLTEKTEELLIIASNDNFVGNSMCLVYSPIRSCVQITEQEQQWIREPFNVTAWSFDKSLSPPLSFSSQALALDVDISPLFPFLSVNLSLKKQKSRKIYQWTYFPYFSVFPWLRVMPLVTSS